MTVTVTPRPQPSMPQPRPAPTVLVCTAGLAAIAARRYAQCLPDPAGIWIMTSIGEAVHYLHRRPDILIHDVDVPGPARYLDLARDAETALIRVNTARSPHGPRLLVAVVRALRPMPRNDPRERRPAPSLAGREMDVLNGMSDGLSNNEIGQRHHISEDTVKTTAQRLFDKLGVHDRAGAVAVGFRTGLLR